ncbi:MAG: hypothetical protein R3B06_02575 [Kofleriaceae bacterium]
MRLRWICSLALAALAAAAVTAAPAAAQRRARRPIVVADKDPAATKPGAKRDKVKQRLRLMRTLVITEQLGLDDATAAKLFPVLGKFDDELAKLLAERAALRAKLTALRGKNKPQELSSAIDQVVANQRARWAAEERRFAEVRALLTPEQAATLLELLPDVDRRILRGLRGALADGADGDDDDAPRRPRRRLRAPAP